MSLLHDAKWDHSLTLVMRNYKVPFSRFIKLIEKTKMILKSDALHFLFCFMN